MGQTRTDEFRKDGVRIALTSGLTRKQVANDRGVGMSTLNKWITRARDTDVVSKEDLSLGPEYLRSGRFHEHLLILTRESARIVRDWVTSIGLETTAYGTHLMRLTKIT